MNKKRLMLLVVSMLLLATMTAGCGSNAVGEEELDGELKRVKLMKVEEQVLGTSQMVPVEVRPSLEADVVAEATGLVVEQKITVGDQVAKGAELITLDQVDLTLNLEGSRLALEKAKLQLTKAEAEYQVQQISAKNNYNQAKNQVEAATRNNERQELLYETGAISLVEVERSREQLEQATGNLVVAEEQLLAVSLQENLKLFEVEAKTADLEYRRIKRQLEKMTVTAPIAGVVVEVQTGLGRQVNAGQPVVRIEQHQPMHLQASLTETDVASLEGRGELEVWFPLLTESMVARVNYIAPSKSAASGGFVLEMVADNESLKLRPGMSAQLILDDSQARPVLAVPNSSLIKNNGDSYIYVVEDQTAYKRLVQTGRTYKEQVEIVGGLTLGEEIVIVGQGLLEEDAVQVMVVD